ncbi:SusD family outer membrane lipoprotein NanU [Emticicia sp. BO119]|uniref:SusD family outer membrane lipoprotein NanU n=1 Tax=Emticicia sp. BO119 TaxID=2757768 RepID=UPI0015EFE34B|nr:SusD family outer membrane lipoprotein NanU [Emticicia sp. BO119]MBA4853675.1 SusD family outer membrane lipoprotein NanU [Emticicia sp. BO119]
MKKTIKNIIICTGLSLAGVSCSSELDLSPVSSISDANYWKTAEQFDAFVSGIHSRYRSHNASFQTLGELRADIFGTEEGNPGAFTGEATQGLERMWLHTLDLDNAGVSNFGGFYSNIVQINLLIDKLNKTNIITPANKSYYLGIAYGMRASYYFHLLRSWGKVVIQTEPITTIDISNLAKAASEESEVISLIKSDIENSVNSFGTNYTFRNNKGFWSKAASLMLKAEAYLWTSYRGGGSNDATTALNALKDIQTNVSGLSLLPNFSSVFEANNKGNSEIIFAIRYQLNEASMSFVQSNFVPQSGLIANFYDLNGSRQFNVTTDNWGGLLRAPVKTSAYNKFDDADSRKLASIQPAYSKSGSDFVLAGSFAKKYQGEQNAGARVLTNDFPVYRYADLLLMIAEAKNILGQNPAEEINLVRKRAFKEKYNESLYAFPNQPGDNNITEAILKERFFEFIFEGKRWYDLRRLGNQYVFANTSLSANESYKILWPIDRNSLTNNRALVQTEGYPNF